MAIERRIATILCGQEGEALEKAKAAVISALPPSMRPLPAATE